MKAGAILVAIGLSFCGLALGQDGSESITFEEFLTGRFGQRGYSGSWISDEELQSRDGSGNVVVLNVATNETTVVIPASTLSQLLADSYDISPDRQLVLISYDTQAQFRHSTTARFLIASLVDQTTQLVANGSLLQTAAWGRNGRNLIYVLNNNVYYTPDVSTVDPVAISTTGVPRVVYNGVPDWVYEEEVLGTGTAYWISPEGNWLIYLEFNDVDVPEMTYFRYGSPGTLLDQYPEEVTIRYPKAGAVNPDHRAYLVNLTDPLLSRILVSTKQDDGVTFGFTWVTEEKFAEVAMTRVQNKSWLNISTTDGELLKSYQHENRRGWIVTSTYLFDITGRYALSIETFLGFRHLILRDMETNADNRVLTHGEFVVLDIIAWDQETGSIYYTANQPGKPYVNQVYMVNWLGGASTCLSCGIVSPEGNNCTSASASFSANFSYVLLTCSAPDPTVVALYRNEQTIQSPVLVLEDNSALRSALKVKALPTQIDTTIDVDGGFLAQVRLQLPPNFDESLKYPLLINVYGGPDSNQVNDGFSVGWGTYLTTNLSVIYGYIDGRGSGRMGDDIMFAGYRNLGTVEIYDQINVTRQLQVKYPWIDAERSAIWGWSYGGYATGRVLELDTEGVFKCGISVAPVTSWLYYDSVYTERYMGLPTEEDNLAGYKDGDLVSHVDNLKTKKYYIIHGNADDNVHYQQSMLLSRALELDDVIFQQQSYPDENHSLGGVSRHLYHSMDKFWKECLIL